MIKCICIDDGRKPIEIPREKWPEQGREYHIVYVAFLQPSGQMAFQLKEINLDESCLPYEYFAADRFMFHTSDLENMQSLIEESTMINNTIADIQGIQFEIFDINNVKIEGQRDLENTIKIIDMLNESGEYPPYHMRKVVE
jgi:hypothetical protein